MSSFNCLGKYCCKHILFSYKINLFSKKFDNHNSPPIQVVVRCYTQGLLKDGDRLPNKSQIALYLYNKFDNLIN